MRYRAFLAAALLALIGCAPKFSNGLEEEKQSATLEILRQARDADIVIFGELHDKFKDNEYVIDILPSLREIGYSVLGLELKQTAKPLLDSYLDGKKSRLGVYLKGFGNRDAQFMQAGPGLELIRRAKELGYDVVALDSYGWDDTKEKRESEFYQHSSDIIRSGRKGIIFAGNAHADKEEQPFCFLACRLDKAYPDRVVSVGLVEQKPDGKRRVDVYLPLVRK